MLAIEKRNRTLVWMAGGGCLLVAAAIWLGTGVGGFRTGDLTLAKPGAPHQVEDGSPSEPSTNSNKSPRRRAQGTDAKAAESVRVEKKLRSLYESTFGTQTGTFDESIYLPDFKRFVEAEGISGVKALSELYTELRIADNRRYGDLEMLLKKVFHDCYMSGSLASMVDVVDALRSGDSSKNGEFSDALASDVMDSFALDQTNSVRIYEEMSTTIPAQEYGQYFDMIAGHAGRWMGYDKALAMLPSNPAFGEREMADTFNHLVVAWALKDPNECREFIDALPQGPEKNRYLASFARSFASNGKFDEAEAILAGLPSNAKEVHEAREAIKRSKELLQKW